ncbi:hypothetical protein PAHAL_2G086300 [Panicum hallii]|uniref:AAA+ ATPase domain-containing protein n=1 Tax=Panicum hallii TaxID=206008 RepID=A0A2S3GWY0_9POAL|nr:putative disease resistance RPP13-like protein 3 isoform X1 [Panicum hallii]XP_025800609.1 putative disease resistance RPP13-like protein 3 isoform X1 [Panicum hallii]XP_025800610.1 putative disease resistance RPP13-like protein 3 isoform X1 [Panicum hallii]PAN10310.1 hypothetical protein PAHAL_2G086300 [Panicum hallii]
MNIATGAMNTLLPKLAELVVGEYKLQKGVKGEIKELEKELTYISAALRKVSEVPVDQLDEQVKVWARDARELSYDIEDAVDTFMLRGKGREQEGQDTSSLKGLIGKAANLYKKARNNHKIHNVIKDIMDQVKKVSECRDRYKVDNIAAGPSLVSVDPRLEAMYRKAAEIVGIDGPKSELVKRLMNEDISSLQQPKIISIVGVGGLGKTTLANALLQDLKAKFDCHFFVSVSFNPDIKKIFKNILVQLDENKYGHIDEAWEINLLINKIIDFLKNRRCLCVIDDLWKELPWDTIKLALQGGTHGSKIIITTRNKAVAEHVGGGIYELKPLSNDDSRELFYKRIFDSLDNFPPDLSKATEKILKKCGGVPLAIITTASLLATKPRCSVEWEKVNNFIGSGSENSPHVDKMNTIIRLSYNDLPFHLKTCLLSLSKYPEDQVIRKDVLVWSWIAEGFITRVGSNLQETGEGYFNELINRSLIQPVNVISHFHPLGERGAYACQLHDMVLELIIKLSAEEGFATTLLSDGEQAGASSHQREREIIRRLSLHNSSNANASITERKLLSKVRSLDVFGRADLMMPVLSRFCVLRVLQLEDCSGLDNNHLKDLSNLYLLKFLRLQGLKVTELPESIGKLESLETLDIRGAYESVIMLPLSFGKLGKLVRLHADSVELPDGVALENMKSLQELVAIRLTLHAMTEIGKLRELKALELFIEEEPETSTDNWEELVRTCLQMCPNLLQVLVLRAPLVLRSMDFMARVPSGLQTFMCNIHLMAIPRWIDSSLSCLTVLSILLWRARVQLEHLDKLAGLPSLRFLRIRALSPPHEQEKLVIHSSPSSFPCLTELRISCPLMFLKFQPGAMRKLQRFCLGFDARKTAEHFRTNTFDYGFENLPSLQHVVIDFFNYELPKAQDAIRKTINDHPNHPSLDFS